MADLQKIVDDLSKLTVREAADLATLLNKKWGKQPAASRLSDEELERERADLQQRSTPEKFFEKVHALKGKVTDKERFNAPQLAFLREASAIAEFARQLDGARKVCLVADDFPDGRVQTADGTLEVEFTEADMQTRRRGEEYKVACTRFG